ncbi:hypothetical protein GCM10009789_75330 [Kribbella sancticallisti]|uniref:Uncharacterized protein n=1 Tax=Kribbella sancticallisti TaxID=460087 RepID=A0ABN2EM19_9ACTN
MVELLAVLPDRLDTAMTDVQADGSGNVEGGLDVEYGSGDQGFEVKNLSGCHSAPQVDAANHEPKSSGRLPRPPRAVYCADHRPGWLAWACGSIRCGREQVLGGVPDSAAGEVAMPWPS